MTFEKMLDDLINDKLSIKEVFELLQTNEKKKTINYFINRDKVSSEPITDGELSQLAALVSILQILYNSTVGSPISDNQYDTLQELLINMGIPRLTGSVEINEMSKLNHRFPNLRGTLNKVYYLFPDQTTVNKSRRYLDEWVHSMEAKYKKITGKSIDLNDQKVLLQPKYDGVSCILEISPEGKMTWLTRGDTDNNKASNISHIMNIFNDLYVNEIIEDHYCGIKFEIMMTEENKDKINELYHQSYKNSRQIVTATLNSIEPDFKADYLYPVPLRKMADNDSIEFFHPMVYDKFPNEICTLSDRDIIEHFAFANKYVLINENSKLRTDGIVISILDPQIAEILGRENDINNWEVAYKFTEEVCVSRVVDVEFDLSELGFICPVIIFNPVQLKGNTVQRASLSNKERFDELDLYYNDTILVCYDIIPQILKTQQCIDYNNKNRGRNKKIEFIKTCPKCYSELNLDVTNVKCENPRCPSRLIGRILNYCTNLRIQNIGYQTLEVLYVAGYLDKGIRSLYKLKKKTLEIEGLDGFGRLKTKKIVAEIEAKRRLKDYEFFGSLGIIGLSMKTFNMIFNKIPYKEFIDMIMSKNFTSLMDKLLLVDGIAEKKAEILIDYYKETENRIELEKLINELSIIESHGTERKTRGKIVFTGFRSDELQKLLEKEGWEVSDSWSNDTSYLVVKNESTESSKLNKAKEKNVPILTREYVENNWKNLK